MAIKKNKSYCCSIYVVAFLLLALLLAFPSTISATRLSGKLGGGAWGRKGESNGLMVMSGKREVKVMMMSVKEKIANPLQVAGSSLPDCSHACGSCTPCKLKIVTAACGRHSVARQPEACPVSYRCMCRNKSYPVP